MLLDACPNCSGYNFDYNHWVIGRPRLQTGRRSGKVFISSCCAFSLELCRPFDSEDLAATAWKELRKVKSAPVPRLAAMLAQLDQLDWRNKPVHPQPVIL